MCFAIFVEACRRRKFEFVDHVLYRNRRIAEHGQYAGILLFEQPRVNRFTELFLKFPSHVRHAHSHHPGQLLPARHLVLVLQNGPLEIDPLAHNRVQKPDHFGLGVSRAEDDEQLLLLYFMEMLAVDPRRKINLQQFQKQIERFAYGKALKLGSKSPTLSR